MVAAGEGWHNNHHHDPACCSVSHRWWELDVTHLEVKLLQKLGIVTSIVPRREVRHAEALRRSGAAAAKGDRAAAMPEAAAASEVAV